MKAAADAMPWRMLMEDQGSESEEQAFLQLRERLTGQLVNALSPPPAAPSPTKKTGSSGTASAGSSGTPDTWSKP
ncbi:hypothetical protein ACR6C2_08075 [Streptomyces sp. INA 01156]